MAHFVELDANNVVLRGIVVANADTASADGTEKEYIGQAFCERLLGGTWKQTSYNGNFRKNYAGIGYTYDSQRDAFIPPKPYPSWVLDEETCLWNAPVPMPTDDKFYAWDEATQTWIEVTNGA
jgi:hypothetical protein